MNYFEFFDIPVAFTVDEAEVKRKYYANSKRFHPDFYTLESEEKQAKILEKSSLNNEAYRTLMDFDQRMKYVLELKGALEEEGENRVPQDFLMEMMEFNEALMELEMDFDEATYKKALQELEEKEAALYEEIRDVVASNKLMEAELSAAKNFYLKKRYLLRIRENLSNFASP